MYISIMYIYILYVCIYIYDVPPLTPFVADFQLPMLDCQDGTILFQNSLPMISRSHVLVIRFHRFFRFLLSSWPSEHGTVRRPQKDKHW